jgi:hypothetical protein
VDGETAARYIKSTNNKNANTPMVAVSAYSIADSEPTSGVFIASLAKPVQKADLLSVMKQLGFRGIYVRFDLHFVRCSCLYFSLDQGAWQPQLQGCLAVTVWAIQRSFLFVPLLFLFF